MKKPSSSHLGVLVLTLSLVLSGALGLSLFPAPALAAEPPANVSVDVSAQIAELIAAGDTSASETIASGLTDPAQTDPYFENLTEDELRYISVEAGIGQDGAFTYNVVIYAEPQWLTDDELAAQPMLLEDTNFQETLKEAWENLSSAAYVGNFGIKRDDIARAYYEAIIAAPEQFNVRTWWNYTYDKATGAVKQVQPRYITTDVSEYSKMRSAYEAKINTALDQIPCGATELAKVYSLGMWVVNNTAYNYSAAANDTSNGAGSSYPKVFTAYGSIVEGSAVCQGYSLGFSDLLNRAGITNTTLFVATSNHAWNMVKLGGNWYHIDTTWTDIHNSLAWFMRSDAGIQSSDNQVSSLTHTNWQSSSNYGWDSSMVASDTTYDTYATPDWEKIKTGDSNAHTWDAGVVTTEPTRAKEGLKTFTCKVCGATKTEAIAKLASVSWSRLWGSIRYDTMKAISAEGWSKSSTVIIASGEGYADALSASSLAGLKGCPILLTAKNTLSEQTRSEIKRLGATTAYVVGGPAAISYSVDDQIKAAGCNNVVRRFGQTRQGTALAIAKELGSSQGDTCVIASGSGFADALAIAPYSYTHEAPIYLTEGDTKLSSATLSAIRSAGFEKAIIVGGNAAVSASVEAQLKSCGVTSITRKGGATRYETSSLIASWCVSQGMTTNYMAVASGEGFADALAGGALCGKNNSVLVIASGSNRSAISGFVASNKNNIVSGYVFGGESAVSRSTWNALPR